MSSNENLSISIHDSSQNGIAADRLQHLHDLRMVWASAESQRQEVVRSGGNQLGDRAVRVHVHDSREPYRSDRVVASAAQDSSGSDHARCLPAIRGALHEAAASARLS